MGPEEAAGCWEAGAAPLWGQLGAGGVRPGNDFKLNRAGSGEVLRRNFHSEGGEAEELWVPRP